MPELPEVETVRLFLNQKIIGKKIKSIKVLNAKSLSGDYKKILNQPIIRLTRLGKQLSIHFSHGLSFLIHLKMTGQLILVGKKEKIAGGHSLSDSSFQAAVGGELPNKHTRAVFSFKNAFQLFFNDLRKFGYLKVVDEAELRKIIAHGYGPEPLTKEFTLEYLTSVLKNKKISIKGLLLNQKLIAGLGNIYVDESLYLAKIRPDRAAGSLKKSEIQALYQAINQVINKAIKYRGTTFNNYVDSAGRKGNFSRLLHVYGRAKQACFKCGTPIQKKKLAGRGTHYCPHCQK